MMQLSLKEFRNLILVFYWMVSTKAQDEDYGAYDYAYGQNGGTDGSYYGNYSNYYGNFSNYMGNYSNYYGNYYGNYSNYYGNYGNNSDYNYLPPLPDPVTTELTEVDGVITSPGYPSEANPESTYPSNANYIWFREGDAKTIVQYKIWDLGIEIGAGNSNVTCDFDYLNVSITSIGWKKYCGFAAPPNEIKGMGSLYVQLVSDSSANFWGFTSSYRIKEDYNPCEPSPCGNGECEVEDLLPKCVCEAGYTGDQCTINIQECESNPCQNGGTCDESNRVNEYICRCTSEYEGTHCERAKPLPCDTNPCFNDGACENVGSRSYRCTCLDGFEGMRCENRIGEQATEEQNPIVLQESRNLPNIESEEQIPERPSGRPRPRPRSNRGGSEPSQAEAEKPKLSCSQCKYSIYVLVAAYTLSFLVIENC